MVKPIMRDLFFLRQRAEKATKGDLPVAAYLLDTLKAHEDGCVGMGALFDCITLFCKKDMIQ